MNNYWTYEEYIEWDREYRDMEYMLEEPTMDDIREYISKKYGVDDDD